MMRAVVFANGVMERWPSGFRIFPGRDLIIAADGGLRHCRRWGLEPRIVVGDLDSADPGDLAALDRTSTDVVRHPAGKDETDLELALKLAVERGTDDIVVLGALGARWDMTFSNMMLLGAAFLEHARVRMLDASEEFVCLRGGRWIELQGCPGDRVSLLPLTGDAEGVTLHGLSYPLENAVLSAGSSQGVSNVFAEETARIELARGLLLIAVSRRSWEKAPHPPARTDME